MTDDDTLLRLRVDEARTEMLLGGDFRKAEKILLEVLRDRPGARTATFLAGVAALYRKRFERARRLITRTYVKRRWIDDRIPAPLTLEILAEAARALPDWDWPRYQIARERWRAAGLSVADAARHLARVRGSTPTFVQVGANDGESGDPLHDLIVSREIRGLLVEPQAQPFERLCANYAGVEGLRFENAAVTEVDGPIEMLTATGRTTIGSITPDRTILHLHPGELRTVTVEGRTFGSILARHGIERFDILQVDTEGYDYKVLCQVDLRARGVTIVNLEYFCLPVEERFAVCERLAAAGFAWVFGRRDILGVDREIFGETFCVTDLLPGAPMTPGPSAAGG